MRFGLFVFAGVVSAALVGCSDDDDFNPVGKKRDAASELAEIPCDGANEGLRVIVGSNKDKEAGCTFDNVVKSTCYLSDIANFGAMNAVYGKYFKQDPPARAAFAVRTLPKEVMVEIEMIAAL